MFFLMMTLNILSGMGDYVGKYTASAGYKWLTADRIDSHHDQSWSWTRKIHALPKIKSFIWCVYHQAIPNPSLPHHRGMSATNVSSLFDSGRNRPPLFEGFSFSYKNFACH